MITEEAVMTSGYDVFALTFTWILPAIVSKQNQYVIDIFSDVYLQSIRLLIRSKSKTATTVLFLFTLAFTALGINLIWN
jgi:hypothetical protein